MSTFYLTLVDECSTMHTRWEERAGYDRVIPHRMRRNASGQVDISKTMSGALRRRQLVGMDKEGWTPVRTARNIKRLTELYTKMGDIRIIANG